MSRTSDSTTKRCTSCEQEYLPTKEYFHAVRSGSDKLRSICKSCNNAKNREWTRTKATPQFRARRALQQREYYSRNREAIHARDHLRNEKPSRKASRKAARREWYDNNRPAIREYHTEYRRSKPEVRKAQSERRRALKKQATGTFTAEDIRLLMKMQHGKCWWCEADLDDKYHVDHRIPLSRGGSNDPSNLCLACPTCNTSKQDKLPHEWSGRLL